METLNDRLKKIADKRKELDRLANEEDIRKRETIAKYENDIKALAPRLDALMTIAIELCRNNIPLGRKTKRIHGGYYGELVTDAITHGLGFYLKFSKEGGRLTGIGICGGGCAGEDLAVSSTGTIIVNPLECIIGLWTYDRAYSDFVEKCEWFLGSFDEFEKRVLEYVDNL